MVKVEDFSLAKVEYAASATGLTADICTCPLGMYRLIKIGCAVSVQSGTLALVYVRRDGFTYCVSGGTSRPTGAYSASTVLDLILFPGDVLVAADALGALNVRGYACYQDIAVLEPTFKRGRRG